MVEQFMTKADIGPVFPPEACPAHNGSAILGMVQTDLTVPNKPDGAK